MFTWVSITIYDDSLSFSNWLLSLAAAVDYILVMIIVLIAKMVKSD